MKTITALKLGKRREKRVNVFLDGSFAFSLAADLVAHANLRVGQQLSPAREKELSGADEYTRCFNAAARFLGYRPRSESELRDRMRERGYTSGVVNKVVARLKELELLDDAAFARYWAENREEFSPRGRRLVEMELRRKGLDRETIESAVTVVDEDAGARRAAEKKLASLPADDYNVFRRRLWAYLGRRGFDYETINRTVETIWKEKRNSTS